MGLLAPNIGDVGVLRQDSVSYALMLIALLGTVYLATFSTTSVVLFPAILLLVGFFGERIIERRRRSIEEDSTSSRGDMRIIGYYSVLALAGMFIAGYAVNLVDFGGLALGEFDSVVYSVLIAIAETQFFQGFVLEALFSSNLPFLAGQPVMACFVGAGVCVVYHLARYGADFNALVYVFVGFSVLNWVSWRSRRLSPAMIGHGMNNLLSNLGFSIAQVAGAVV